MSDGVKGGAVNRPASAQEIQKLPRGRCVVCGMEGPAPMVINSRCRNEVACRLRAERNHHRQEQKP